LPDCGRTRPRCATVACGMRRYSVRARGEERPDSDVDIMIEVNPEARIGIYEYVAIKDYIAGLFDTRVDVVRRDRLKPYIRPVATRDAIYAFRPGFYAAPAQ
jgi:uncharacterized protein